MQSFIEAHTEALDQSMQTVSMSSIMRERLSKSNYVFSGMKTFHELNEAFPSLLDEKGDRKPFEQFLNDVRSIDQTYNQNYLRAEYNFINASAEMAAKWEQIEQDGDDYNLQYRTQNDGKVRPEHAELNGITLPPSDAFWDVCYPPNGWNCRCTVVQVRKEKYPVTPKDEVSERATIALSKDKKGMFRFNSGKQGKSVPDYNPYTISRCRDCDIPNTMSFIPENELCAACRIVRISQRDRANKKLTRDEFRLATEKANNWANENLHDAVINGVESKRTTVVSQDGHNIHVGKKFFTETAANNKPNRNLVHVLKCATEFEEWIPNAHLVRHEDGYDHDFGFSVFQVVHDGELIEFKCKMTQGEILYTMRII